MFFDGLTWKSSLKRLGRNGSGSAKRLGRGGKVGGHEALQVEVRELVVILELEQLLQLGVGQNAAAVVLVLKLVVADVGVDFAGDFGSCHLGAVALAEKSGQLVGNEGGLHEPGGLAVDVLCDASSRWLCGQREARARLGAR